MRRNNVMRQRATLSQGARSRHLWCANLVHSQLGLSQHMHNSLLRKLGFD